ncbi:MAG: hypothetical protein COW24_04595 [Candidatus Kerfeldbacteria bacterium CG15_BIG_FIL_POST_REV_8_21_14_020_45_12]|uniref:Uncharacterized protein n=1 Tax=Candidatus Kerfeldbacteria bacterium CG15_BIG_FIL_POST_REV_8_21_14_020_45_12 TaxID=2014247 RepID=A0A2M7H2Z4_9BACT|nr:MAG: hypothetical protein COW24_04595 [Candidatus Kerfeldbacteria bacterium CG15_BIG_FIL_POST_REV_8_21_14_020_45_12]PJA93370.1 MAG: hypothetical protein CO132_03370 [Candidatus Kerfeldbacteria bacterium CG_4_9_14_3_um_filter_45_8]
MRLREGKKEPGPQLRVRAVDLFQEQQAADQQFRPERDLDREWLLAPTTESPTHEEWYEHGMVTADCTVLFPNQPIEQSSILIMRFLGGRSVISPILRGKHPEEDAEKFYQYMIKNSLTLRQATLIRPDARLALDRELVPVMQQRLTAQQENGLSVGGALSAQKSSFAPKEYTPQQFVSDTVNLCILDDAVMEYVQKERAAFQPIFEDALTVAIENIKLEDNWEFYANVAANIRLIFPELLETTPGPEMTWAHLRLDMEKLRHNETKSGYSNDARNMTILAAKQAWISQGRIHWTPAAQASDDHQMLPPRAVA